ncbi:MAG: hypothetical protein K2O17_06625 [Bacteroidaceae bacterium]|nr:hypothetical protein [Bacteroidaceae bacterium]
MNKVREENIRELLVRYLDGVSTQEELRGLGEYFGNTANLPADLIPYAQMFALLDEKPKTPTAEALDRFSSPPPRKRWSIFLLPLSAAACIAAFVCILLMSPERVENTAVAYIDGKMVDDKQTAMQMGLEALQEIFSNGSQEEQQLSELFNEQ